MNSLRLTSILLLTILFVISSCSSFTECESISGNEIIILPDVSDSLLYKNIHSDLQSGFPDFMKKSGLGNISSCQSLTIRLAPIGANNILEYSTEKIEISRKGLSNQEEQARANPAPLVELMRNKLNDYSRMSTDKEVTSGSNIANITLKAINSSNIDAISSTIILFSDLIENTRYINMYREIPSGQNLSKAAKNLFDPITRETFDKHRQEGLDPTIIIVSKPNNNSAIDQREVREFWRYILNDELGLQNVEFIDNLSQYQANGL